MPAPQLISTTTEALRALELCPARNRRVHTAYASFLFFSITGSYFYTLTQRRMPPHHQEQLLETSKCRHAGMDPAFATANEHTFEQLPKPEDWDQQRKGKRDGLIPDAAENL